MTPHESDMLLLGYMLRSDEAKEQSKRGGRRRKYSNPQQSTDQAMKEYQQKLDAAT